MANIPQEVRSGIRGEEYIWDATSHLPGFKDDALLYWQSCLTLSRRLIRIFAIVLGLPENHFDSVTTYPGSDGVFNFYAGTKPDEIKNSIDVGLGSHTDLQCFTLLWQDMIGGLQVLTQEGQWIKASPIPDTIVVNIGDFLMRLSNDKFKSTVHRVYNRSTEDRLSMPFFFGFNFNEILSVLPTCIDENNPPKYEPISCGEVSVFLRRRLLLSNCYSTANFVLSRGLPSSRQVIANYPWARYCTSLAEAKDYLRTICQFRDTLDNKSSFALIQSRQSILPHAA